MRKKTILLMVSALCIAGAAAAGQKSGEGKSGKILINEVCSNNYTNIRDGVHDCSDYIELYNTSEETVDLDGWYLSDDMENLSKYRIRDLSIEPHGYLLLYADGISDETESVGFRLKKTGESLYLLDADGAAVDSVQIPALKNDEVYGRERDGSEVWMVKTATPGSSNEGGSRILEPTLSAPAFSHDSGFYEEAFELTMSAEKGSSIYYTTDGSEPDTDSEKYEAPIRIEDRSSEPDIFETVQNLVEYWLGHEEDSERSEKGTVLRAVAVGENGEISEVVTATFFVGLDSYREANVLSVTADPEELFGENGIFVTGKEYDDWYLAGAVEDPIKGHPEANFWKRGKSWEEEANLEFFLAGSEILNQPVGIRVQGKAGRNLAKKRMSIFAREDYSGSDYFDTELFEGERTHSVMLNEAFANAAFPQLVQDRAVALQDAVPVQVFLNGEYWYEKNMLEKYNKYYVEDHYQVEAENVLMIKNGAVETGGDENYALLEELLEFAAEENLALDRNYEKISEMIDIQSFIDFISINVYLCNMDMSEDKNYILWRTIQEDGSEYGDTRWRWMLYDTDCIHWVDPSVYSVGIRAAIDSFNQVQQYTGKAIKENSLLMALKQNEGFRRQFVLSFLDIANENFSTENVTEVFAGYGEDLTWNDSFFAQRFEWVVPYMAIQFGLQGTLETVVLENEMPEAGTIRLNTMEPTLRDGSWIGRYYTDYPITVSAEAEEGYRFVGWEIVCRDAGDGESSYINTKETAELSVVTGGMTLRAMFEKEVDTADTAH